MDHNRFLSFISLILFLFIHSCASLQSQNPEANKKIYAKSSPDALKKKNSIEGYILDSITKKGVANALVEIKNANLGIGYYKVNTDEKGFFKIEDFLPYINYIVEVAKDGYVDYFSKGIIREGQTKIFLNPEAILKGEVKDSAGNPLQGVTVKIRQGYYYSYSGGDSSRPRIVQTTEKGIYLFNKLQALSYLVSFEKPGYINETLHLKNIKKGEIFQLPMIMLKPASFSGKISIAELDSPAINVNVALKGNTTYSATSFPDGTFQIDDLKPGKYHLSTYHQGFYKIETANIYVREGEQIKDYNFIVRPKPPKISVYSYRYTFVPGMKLDFNLRVFRLEKIKAKLYRVPMHIVLEGRQDPNMLNPLSQGFELVDSWDEAIKNFRPYDWRYQNLEITKALPTGGYCIEVSGNGNVKDRKFFTVTSVGVIVKRSQKRVVAYVSNLITNKPVADVPVLLFDNTPGKKIYRNSQYAYNPPQRLEDLPFRIIYKGKTGKDGLFNHYLPDNKHVSILAVAEDSSYALSSTGSPYVFQRERIKYFIYTERPVYRAGDKVFYKIIGKKRDKKFQALDGQGLYYQIKNVDFNRIVEEGEIKLDSWGTYHGTMVMGKDARLGEYEIRTGPNPKEIYSSGRFYVEEYRKPEFKIEISPDRDYYINGDKASFKVETKYFFGAPLKGALVRYRFYEKRLSDTDTSYWWENDYNNSASYNKLKLEGEKYLDANGIATLDIFVGHFPYDRNLILEATVVDQSNVSITSRETVKVGRGEFYIKILPSRSFYEKEEKDKKIKFLTMTYTGKAVSARLKVEIFPYIWKSWQRVYVHAKRAVYKREIQSNESGIAQVVLPEKFALSGEFDILVSGIDRRDNEIKASRVIWVYSSAGGLVNSHLGNLELSVNRSKLKGPGKVTVLIKSRFPNSYVFLTLEGRDIYQERLVKLNGNILPVEFDIKASYAPNLFVVATMQHKRALFRGYKSLDLPSRDVDLNFSIVPDKQKYFPGDKAVIKIKVTDQNKRAVSADLSLGVVDEAIYQIRSDHTPLMKDFFYTKISNWVLTQYSFPITVLAGAGKEGKVKVRSKFRDTAFWKADVRTDENGDAELRVPLPDNLTTWRLTVRGHDRNGRMGEEKKKILVTQDLIARLGKPRFFLEGDESNLIGIVNSNTSRGLLNVRTRLDINGQEIQPEEKINISLPPFGSARHFYPVKIPINQKELKVLFKAWADVEAKDGLEIKIPINSKGMDFELYGMGDMLSNQSVKLVPPRNTEEFRFEPRELEISVNPSPLFKMIRATSFLMDYPYGCVEQTINRFLPALALRHLLSKKGLEGLLIIKDLENKVKIGIKGVENYQNFDGTWGWWGGDRGNEFLTGFALHSLYQANKLGFPISEDVTRRGVTALERMIKHYLKFDKDALSYLLYVYALYGRWNDYSFESLLKEKSLNPYALSFLIRTMALAKNIKSLSPETKKNINRSIGEYVQKLKSEVKKDEHGIYLASSGRQDWGFQGGKTEISAHALSALLDAGDQSALIPQLVNSISRRGMGESWRSTKETGTVLFSLSKYLSHIPGEITGKGDLDFYQGMVKIANVNFDLEKADRFTIQRSLKRTIPINIAQDAGKENRDMIISAKGLSGPDVSFDLTLHGNLYFNEKGILSFFKSESSSIKALNNGINIERSFFTVTKIRDIRNNEFLIPQEVSQSSKIKVGDEILVKLKFEAQDDFEYMVLEDFLASGFEVTRKDAYQGIKPYSQVERRDNRMVFFINQVKKGQVYEIAYILRAELPGKFLAKPAKIQCMYEPSIQGWAKPWRFHVEKK